MNGTEFLTVVLYGALGYTLLDLARHFIEGVRLARRGRDLKRREALEAWRQQQLAKSRTTYPTAPKPPHLGLDESSSQSERKRA